MPITRTAMVDDDGSGMTGTVTNNAWKTEFYNQIDAFVGGTWTQIAFSAANFAATGGTWTVASGNVVAAEYLVMNKTLWLNLYVNGTTVGGTPSALIFGLTTATGKSVANTGAMPFTYDATGATGSAGMAQVHISTPGQVNLYRNISASLTWPAGAVSIAFLMPIHIN